MIVDAQAREAQTQMLLEYKKTNLILGELAHLLMVWPC